MTRREINLPCQSFDDLFNAHPSSQCKTIHDIEMKKFMDDNEIDKSHVQVMYTNQDNGGVKMILTKRDPLEEESTYLHNEVM